MSTWVCLDTCAKGCDDLFGHDGSRRATTHPNDATIRDGDLWSPYKRIRVHNQGSHICNIRRE
jgi:hypothetical protein